MTLEGRRPVDFAPRGDVWRRRAYGGPNVLALVYADRRDSAETLVLARFPAEGRAHVKLAGTCHGALFDATGARLALIVFRDEYFVEVWDVARAKQIASAPCTSDPDPDEAGDCPTLVWDGDLVVAAVNGIGTVVDARTGKASTRAIPHPTGVGWRHYGRGAPKYHPACDRLAWMTCTEYGDGTTVGTTLITWRDGDGRHGGVAVPDEGWGDRDESFATIAVRADGSIVAVGTRIWFVPPSGDHVLDLGPAGASADHLVIHEGRLYSHGAGPWWIELPQ